MTDRYELKVARKYTTRDGQEKTAWTRVGAMFRSKNSDSFGIHLEVMPLPDKETGAIRIMAFVPEEKTDGGGQQRQQYGSRPAQQSDGFSPGGDDEIPF